MKQSPDQNKERECHNKHAAATIPERQQQNAQCVCEYDLCENDWVGCSLGDERWIFTGELWVERAAHGEGFSCLLISDSTALKAHLTQRTAQHHLEHS